MHKSIGMISSLVLLAATAPALAQSPKAFDHANDNASFRCGTKHPTPEQQKLIEEQFQAFESENRWQETG